MFEQVKLPYAFEDLEPHFDTLTMETHYLKQKMLELMTSLLKLYLHIGNVRVRVSQMLKEYVTMVVVISTITYSLDSYQMILLMNLQVNLQTLLIILLEAMILLGKN